MYELSTEDSYDGSGSGSGAGVDDEDSHAGSGMGNYDYPSRVPGHTDYAAPSFPTASPPTSHHDDRSPTTTTSTTHSDGKDRVHTHHEYDERENEVNPHDRKKGSSSVGSRLGSAGGMSLRQAMLTYAFPIYVAWFGGTLCDLF